MDSGVDNRSNVRMRLHIDHGNHMAESGSLLPKGLGATFSGCIRQKKAMRIGLSWTTIQCGRNYSQRLDSCEKGPCAVGVVVHGSNSLATVSRDRSAIHPFCRATTSEFGTEFAWWTTKSPVGCSVVRARKKSGTSWTLPRPSKPTGTIIVALLREQ